MKVRRLLATVAFVLIASPLFALAHDGVAEHGGIMNSNAASEVSIELVAAKGMVTLYLEDHNQPAETKGANGTLSIVRKGSTITANVQSAGGNTVVAHGVSIASGDRVTVTLHMANGTAVMGRFMVR
jgi:hypothetical protein